MSIEGFNPKVQFPNSLIYDGIAPVANTDLDCSSVIGARSCLILFSILKDSANTRNFQFRKNGETALQTTYGVNMVQISQNYKGQVLCVSDSAGIVEWIAAAAEQCKVYIEAYAYV